MKLHPSKIAFEFLEPRRLLSGELAVSPNINLSKELGNQAETAIAIDPHNPARLFALSNEEGMGLMASRSTNGGASWNTKTLAAGDVQLTTACCDPSCAFDNFGNLFVSYLDEPGTSAVVLLS